MLILTRRTGQTLVIGDVIRVTVLGTRGHQVRLGVEAPREIGVHREEILDRRAVPAAGKTATDIGRAT